jgi:predicted TPR repeat methyltransferase
MNPPESETPSSSTPDAEPGMTLERALMIGMHLHKTGRLVEAEEVYRAVLAREPNQVEAMHFLGLLLHQAGLEEDGLELLQKVTALAPDYVDAQSNLGNMLRARGRLEEAAEAYRRAIRSNPRHAQAYNNLGVVLKDLGRLGVAAEALTRAIELAPERGDAHFNLANILMLLGNEEQALVEYRQAIERQPGLIYAYDALSRALRNNGREQEAVEVLEGLMRRMPDSPLVRHLIAAATGKDVPAQAAEAYVQTIFDGFADTFDHVLSALEYRAPSLVAGLVTRKWAVADASLEVLDAGCGTGLCGPLLRPYARRLVGVDLSAGMLSKARGRHLYDELIQAELTAYLAAHPGGYDLVASADTLVYFGDLGPAFQAAAAALRPGGLLVFSVEDAGESAPHGFQLHDHGRYSHREDYVRTALEAAGLRVSTILHDRLRNERRKPVAGLIIAAEKA